MNEPLYTAEQLESIVYGADGRNMEQYFGSELLKMRRKYENRIADLERSVGQLEAQLAQRWEPVEDGEYNHTHFGAVRIFNNMGPYCESVISDGDSATFLPVNMKVCRRHE